MDILYRNENYIRHILCEERKRIKISACDTTATDTERKSSFFLCERMDTTDKRLERINNKTWNKNKTAHKNLSMHDDTALWLHGISHEFGTWSQPKCEWIYKRASRRSDAMRRKWPNMSTKKRFGLRYVINWRRSDGMEMSALKIWRQLKYLLCNKCPNDMQMHSNKNLIRRIQINVKLRPR